MEENMVLLSALQLFDSFSFFADSEILNINQRYDDVIIYRKLPNSV